MIKAEISLEMLIKTYAKSTSPNGIFVSVLSSNENLAKLLDIPYEEFYRYEYSYLYLTEFNSVEEMKNLFHRIVEESSPDDQYAVLVIDSEISKVFPDS